MNPTCDIICILKETPFSRWREEDKKEAIKCGRPTVLLSIDTEKEIKKTGKSYKIKCKSSWFTEFTWLCSSSYLQRLFCWPCLLLSSRKSVWNKAGFEDFRNITRALHKHDESFEHLKCQLQLKNLEKNGTSIFDANRENDRLYIVKFNENVRLNRLFLQIVIDAVLYLSKQELPFYGHHDSISSLNRGNFRELLALLISRSSSNIQNHYAQIKNVFSGDSKTIQNEIIDCIAEYIQDFVEDELNNTKFFSIQVDDTADINQTSQCSLIVRYVNSESMLVERFLGFYHVNADRSSENLFNLLDTILAEYNYSDKLVGQCYDGASVMSGHLGELQMKIKGKAPQAIFVHCLAHPLNLVLQQNLKKIFKCRIFFAVISGISSFFHESAKRTDMNSFTANRVRTVIDNRWAFSAKLLGVLVDEWHNLKNLFEIIVNNDESDKEAVQLSKSFLNEMNSFEFTFLVVVFNDIFELTDSLFNDLQENSLDINLCLTCIKSTGDLIKSKRNEQCFASLLEKAKSITQYNKRNTHVTDEEVFHKYEILFYVILDSTVMEINIRFQDYQKLYFFCLVDTRKFEEYSTIFPTTALENLHQTYPLLFKKLHRLQNELSVLYHDEKYRNIPTVNVLQLLHENKDVFEEAYKLFSLVLTMPCTDVSADRSFSCLERIKTCTRNLMSQEKLSSLANISIQKDLLCHLIKNQPFYEDITDKFAALKNRRIDLSYKK